jgi:molecular chaperone DnaJ
MNNPYEVLGIKEGADKEEIKAAYKQQVKKYHPDKHQDNPLYDLAEEKLQEINAAYDYLMKKYDSGGFDRGYNRSSGSSEAGSYYGASKEFAEVRRAIDRGDLSRAQQILQSSQNHDAEWFFLTAMLQLKRGWYDESVTNLQTAISMDPDNYEYRRAMNSIIGQTGSYQSNSYNRGYQDANRQFCQMMQCWCCAEALCDCI